MKRIRMVVGLNQSNEIVHNGSVQGWERHIRITKDALTIKYEQRNVRRKYVQVPAWDTR
jgi:hypothetical protein